MTRMAHTAVPDKRRDYLQDRTGGGASHFITNVPLGTKFDYALKVTHQ
jgi:hypothetical protein